MKLSIIFFGLLLAGMSAHSQEAVISGKAAAGMSGRDIKLIKTGTVDRAVHIADDGRFTVTVPSPEKGIYTLQGIGRFYLEPGYAISVSPDGQDGYSFTGKGAIEAGILKNTPKKLQDFLPMLKGGNEFQFATYNMGVDTFLQKMDAFRSLGKRMIGSSSSGYFKELAGKDLNYFCLNKMYNYKLYYGVDSVKQQAFYALLQSPSTLPAAERNKKIQKAYEGTHTRKMRPEETKLLDSLYNSSFDKNDGELFRNSSEYRESLAEMIRAKMYKDFGSAFEAHKDQNLIQLMVVDKNISDSFIRDYYTYTYTENIIKMSKEPALKDSLYKSFMASSPRADYRAAIEKIYSNYQNFADNKMAPEFDYTGLSGKNVSLKSLRGKYVYIDVWATWCGPCKAEIPHLMKLEEKMAGKNIHFVSLSVDVPADRDKWKQYVQEHHLKGIQLIADNAFDSDFIKKFNINAIPRFILIDPAGKIIAANALRPSNPELQGQLDKLVGNPLP